MIAGLVQLCSGDDPEANLSKTRRLVRDAAEKGAEFVLTPEVTNCVSASRTRQRCRIERQFDHRRSFEL